MGRHVGQHADSAAIMAELDKAPIMLGCQMVGLDLDEGDTAWDPSTPDRVIGGPALVIYRQYADGGIVATRTDRD